MNIFSEHEIDKKKTFPQIKKTLGRTLVSLDQLLTVVVEIESMLNHRPLTYVSSDLLDPQPLTPSHLLYGRRMLPIPLLTKKN